MAERPTMSELEMWRVEELSADFADRVLARMDDSVALEDDASVLLTDPDEVSVRVTPLPRSRWFGVVTLACAAAAALVLWLLRPVPPALLPPPQPRVVVSIAEPTQPAARGLDDAAIRRTVNEKLLPHAQRCHETLAINTTFASGQMVLELDVVRRDDRGVVARAAFDPTSELDDPTFRDCILEGARKMTFDPPQGDAPVEIVVLMELEDPWASKDSVPAD